MKLRLWQHGEAPEDDGSRVEKLREAKAGDGLVVHMAAAMLRRAVVAIAVDSHVHRRPSQHALRTREARTQGLY